MSADLYKGAPKNDLGPVIDPACMDQLEVTSTLVPHKGREHVLVTTTCQRCASCVVAWAAEVGEARQLQDISRNFCAPGQFEEA